MSPTAAPAATRTATEPAVASEERALAPPEEASRSRPAAGTSGPRGSGSRLVVLLLLLVAVATAAALSAVTTLPRLSEGVSTTPELLARPGTVLPVAAVALSLVLLLGAALTRLARLGRRVHTRRYLRDSGLREASQQERGSDHQDELDTGNQVDSADVAGLGDEDATETGAGDPVGVDAALEISSHALELQVRCLEATLAEQDEVLAHQERALGQHRAALVEARELADQQAAAARETERRRARATVHALRDVVAELPGHVAADRVATALERLSVEPGFARPLLAPPAEVGLPVVFAAPAPSPQPHAAPAPTAHAAPAPTAPAPAAPAPTEPAPTVPAPTAPQEPATLGEPVPADHEPVPSERVEPAAVVPPTAPRPPAKVLPVPAPAPAPAPVRARRGLLRSRSS